MVDYDKFEEWYSSDDEITDLLEKNIKLSKDVKNVINDDQFFKPLSLNVNVTSAELLLMGLKYSVNNKLPITGISDLFKLINRMFRRIVVPESRYMIDQICKPADDITLHGICLVCTKYIGKFTDFNTHICCTNCHMEVDMSNPSNQCFFSMIDPSDAIREYLETHEDYYSYVLNGRQHEINSIKDIYDGNLYRKFVKNLSDVDRHAYATVIFNTDGAPVFKSSAFSIWPIYITLNEIPLQDRLKSVIVVGLWFGRNKPEMTVFLDVFVKLMNNLSSTGILCTIRNVELRIKIYTLLCCVDTMARYPMNGTSQFNAYYGCDWCLHKGEYFAGSMRYPFQVPFPKDRTHSETVAYATEAVEKNRRIFGVKTASPLLNLLHFDIIEGFTPDYMHCYVSGVVLQFMDITVRYLTKTDITYIDELLTKIRSPTQIGRLSRSFKDRGYWKAREYENWTLYYCIPVLCTVLKNNVILQNWSRLVECLYICLQTNITFDELNRVNELLCTFVSEFEDIDSLAGLTYNVHQLLHLAKSVYNWGPLYAHSSYPFEAANHELLQAVHCAKGVISQITRYRNIQLTIKFLESKVYPECSGPILEYCESITNKSSKTSFKISSVTYFGKSRSLSKHLTNKYQIANSARTYNRIVLNGCLFKTCQKQNKRSCSYYAQLVNGKFVKLVHFIVDENSSQELTLCKVIKTKSHKYTNVLKEFVEIDSEICIKTNEISRICVAVEIEDNIFFTPVPNMLHY